MVTLKGSSHLVHEAIWSAFRSLCNCHLTYCLICSSSKPIVLTQYPFAQKWRPSIAFSTHDGSRKSWSHSCLSKNQWLLKSNTLGVSTIPDGYGRSGCCLPECRSFSIYITAGWYPAAICPTLLWESGNGISGTIQHGIYIPIQHVLTSWTASLNTSFRLLGSPPKSLGRYSFSVNL